MDTECSHKNTVWIGWTDGSYVAAWKCQSCGDVLYPNPVDATNELRPE